MTTRQDRIELNAPENAEEEQILIALDALNRAVRAIDTARDDLAGRTDRTGTTESLIAALDRASEAVGNITHSEVWCEFVEVEPDDA